MDSPRDDGDVADLANPLPDAPAEGASAGSTEEAMAAYRLLFQQSRDIILFVSPKGRIVDGNPAALAAYGYDHATLTTLTIADLRDPSTFDDLSQQLRRADAEGVLFETRHRHRDGTTFPVEVNSLGADVDGQRLLLSIVRDISERKRAEETRAWLSASVESSQDAIISFDLEARVTSWNAAATRMFGYTFEEVVGRRMADAAPSFVPPDRFDEPMGYFVQVIRGESFADLETVRIRRDGTPIEIAISGYPIRDAGGDVIGIGTDVRDITARKHADAARERFHAEREALLDSAAEGIFGMDANGDCTFINPAAIAMLGFAPGEVLGRDMHGLIHHSRPDGSPYPIEECPINTAFEEGRSLHLVEEVLWRKDGTAFPALYSVSTVVEGRVVTGGVVTIVDITERKRAEEEVRASEARFRAIFEQAAAGIAQVGLEGRWLNVNRRLSEIVGHSEQELLAGTYQEITRPDDLEADFDLGNRLIAGEVVDTPLQKRYIRKDGSLVWVELTVTLVRDASGAPAYFNTVVTDISARKRAEERLRLLREASDILAASLDYEGTLRAVTSLAVPGFADWCALFVREPHGQIRRIEADYAEPSKRALAQELQFYTASTTPSAVVAAPIGAAAVMRTGRPELYPDVPDSFWQAIARGPEHLALLRRLRQRSLMLVPLRARGQTLGVVALATAESGRRYGEDDLIFAEAFAERAAVAIDNARLLREAQAAEARYRGLFSGAAESIVAYGADGRLLEANDAVLALLGYERDELKEIGNGGTQFLAEGTELALIAAELERRGEWHGEVEVRRKDGSTVPVEANVARIDLPEGPVYLALWHDISERKARDRFEHEFLADVAHDLKNPLTAARVQAQVMTRRLRAGRLDESTVGEGLAAIESNTARMARRIDELGDIAQLRLGRTLQLRPEPTDLVALAEQLAATWRQTTDRHEIRVVAAVPALIGDWDAMRLERVIENLLSNAVKYSPRGGPIEVRIERDESPGSKCAVLTVRDEGIGIPAADLPWIFERFRRAGNVAGRVAGTGIGLAGARQIVAQHGGTIAVASEAGRGTTVTVRLPTEGLGAGGSNPSL
ncbi:MAG: hypothetical protein QOJ59_2719 [Thermomicrobiales bacterium]|nr:hypothetical protein [Thermomicrobiales bacterium]